MPRKSGTKANAKGVITDGAHVLDSNPTGGTGGPIRGGSTSRGGKRRRTSNNVNSANANDIYGGETIVAANPFDDDNHHHNHHPPAIHHTHQPQIHPHHANSTLMQQHPQHHHLQQHQQHHHLQQHHQLQHPQQPHPHMHPQQQQMQQPQQMQQSQQMQQPQQTHMYHSMSNNVPNSTSPGTKMGVMSPSIQYQQANQMHQIYSPNYVTHTPPLQQQMSIPPTHSGPQHLQQAMHNQGSHMMAGQPTHLPQDQMIGTSTSPHIMDAGPAPSHSPYIHQQPYTTNQGVFCGKCQREIYQNEPNIVCKALCSACYHISCSGLTQLACDLLMRESSAEWACDRCTSARRVPLVKFKNREMMYPFKN